MVGQNSSGLEGFKEEWSIEASVDNGSRSSKRVTKKDGRLLLVELGECLFIPLSR
jgi:hypothetical protein